MKIMCINADRSGSQLQLYRIYEAVEIKNENEELIAYRLNNIRTPSMIVGWDPERFRVMKDIEVVINFCEQVIDVFSKKQNVEALKNCVDCRKFGKACIVGKIVKEVSGHKFSCWKPERRKS